MYKITIATIWKKYANKGDHDLYDLYASDTAVDNWVPKRSSMTATIKPRTNTAIPAIVNWVPEINDDVPGKFRKTASTITRTITLAINRMNAGMIGLKPPQDPVCED